MDATPPVSAASPTDPYTLALHDALPILPDFTGELTVTDACSVVTLVQNPLPGTELSLGEHLVTFTATDTASNSSSCTMTLAAIDNSAPDIVTGLTNFNLSADTNCSAVLPDRKSDV